MAKLHHTRLIMDLWSHEPLCPGCVKQLFGHAIDSAVLALPSEAQQAFSHMDVAQFTEPADEDQQLHLYEDPGAPGAETLQ